ncbi:hypothetical protein AAY473_000169 [Plecturocebus cupreus]
MQTFPMLYFSRILWRRDFTILASLLLDEALGAQAKGAPGAQRKEGTRLRIIFAEEGREEKGNEERKRKRGDQRGQNRRDGKEKRKEKRDRRQRAKKTELKREKAKRRAEFMRKETK